MPGFGDYFFDRLFFLKNPLPLAFNPEIAKKWGLVMDPNSDVARVIEGGGVSSNILANINLVVFRVFIRNIRDRNIVNHLRVEAKKIGDNDFPWDQLDVDTKLNFSLKSGTRLQLDIIAEKTPILALDLTIKINSGDASVEVSKSMELLRNTNFLHTDIPRLALFSPDWPVSFYINPKKSGQLKLEPQWYKTKQQLIDELSQVDGFEAYFQQQDYIYGNCPDGGIVIAGKASSLQSLLSLASVEALDISYSYELLNGKQISKQQHLALPEFARLLDEDIEPGFPKAQDCMGGRLLFFDIGDLPAAGAGVVDDWLGLLDNFALALIDTNKQASPVIKAEETIVFNFQSSGQILQQSVGEINILNDGEYVLLNLIGTNFDGGDYHFRFFFDDEQVGELTANLMWPQALKFTKGDQKYFHPTAQLRPTIE